MKVLADAFQEIVSTNPTPVISSSTTVTNSSVVESSPREGVVSVEKITSKESTSSSQTISQGDPIVRDVTDQQQEQEQKPVEHKEIHQESIKNALKEIISEIDKVVGSSEAEFSSGQSKQPSKQGEVQENKENILSNTTQDTLDTEAFYGVNEGGTEEYVNGSVPQENGHETEQESQIQVTYFS